jgi:D-alanyl-D-alanine carboxypeptidase (penicillin-binding protein 5/6)
MSITYKEGFIQKMNEIAKREGMSTLNFTNPNGLDGNGKFGGQGSALDVARLMAYAYKNIPELIDATTKSRATVISSTGPIRGVPNTNQIVDKFIGVEGSKTGFTDEAGGNLVMIFDVTVGHPVVIVVTGSTRTERFTDVEKLYERTKNALQ